MAKDLDLFRTAMADVTPLADATQRNGRRKAKAPRVVPGPACVLAKPPKANQSSVPEEGLRPSTERTAGLQKRPAADTSTFDRAIDRALARGRRSPQATLDLHGMTLAAAERSVSRFLEEATAVDLGIVLIVTGKGLRREGDRVVGGRIRTEFPGWLQRADNRARVRGVRPAHPRHGGSGAFYVLLRRR